MKKIRKRYRKFILISGQSPGDLLMLTIAVRDLHLAYPKKYKTDIRCPAYEIWENNPYITKLDEKDPDVKIIKMGYPLIHDSGWSGLHFSDGYRMFLEEQLGINIPRTGMRADIHLSDDEKKWTNQVAVTFDYPGKFWILDAGHKVDYDLKGYPAEKWQEVINLLKDKIQLIQIGLIHEDHVHPELDGIWSLVGKTDLRQLIRLHYWCEGVISCVSLPMVLAAAFQKPCVVLAGGREGPRWQYYPNHRFLNMHGTMKCCGWDGCWKSKFKDCVDKAGGVPRCFQLITPKMIADAVLMYYNGGLLSYGGHATGGPIVYG